MYSQDDCKDRRYHHRCHDGLALPDAGQCKHALGVHIPGEEKVDDGDHQQEYPALVSLLFAFKQLGADLVIGRIAQPQQNWRVDRVGDDNGPYACCTAKPSQVHCPWAEHVFDHLADKPTNVLTGRRVVQEHAVLDQSVVGLGNPSRIVLVQVHAKDVHAHLTGDDETSDDKKRGEPFPPVFYPSLSCPSS